MNAYGLGAQFLDEGRLSFRGLNQPRAIKTHVLWWSLAWQNVEDPEWHARNRASIKGLERQWEIQDKVERERGKE